VPLDAHGGAWRRGDVVEVTKARPSCSVDLNIYRAAPLDPEKAALIADVFKKWGIDLTLPANERPKYIEPITPGDAPDDSPTTPVGA